MKKYLPFIVFFFVLFVLVGACSSSVAKGKKNEIKIAKPIKTGADNTEEYLALLRGKAVAVVTNQTGVVQRYDSINNPTSQIHLVDFLLAEGIDVRSVFAPEHGFRGKNDAGEQVKDNRDKKTGLPVYSLHGKYKKPQVNQLEGIDCVVFDIQDVGVRFYTYISTLHYVMEACAEQRVELIVLDRPNPNGHYVDGPIMEEKYKSFLGMHSIPIVYGMTIGEFAQMLVGEKWLHTDSIISLEVVKLQNWTHDSAYVLPIKPSPNLPNATAVALYPSLCLFEQTTVSVGRGTDAPFQIYGSPFFDKSYYSYHFTPRSVEGARDPKHKSKLCYGEDLRESYDEKNRMSQLDFSFLQEAYQRSGKKDKFFKKHFEYLSGTVSLREQLKAGKSMDEIRASWESSLLKFKKVRKKYLLYPDFQ